MPATADATETATAPPGPDHLERELRALRVTIEDGPGFRLILATFDHRARRDDLIARLTAELDNEGIAVAVLDLARPGMAVAGPAPVLLTTVRQFHDRAAADAAGPVAVIVVNLESHIHETRPNGLQVLETANLHRDLFSEACPAPLVLWLPPWATTLLARHAPDLWHWRASTFDFVEATAAPPPAGFLEADRFGHPEFGYLDDAGVRSLEQELGDLAHGPEAATPRERAHRARLRQKLGEALFYRGDWDRALALLHEAAQAFGELGDVRSRAVTMGKIADILQARGQLDEALRIRQEEQLPVYERLGDVRERAMTMGNIADILQSRGQLDEALRILRDEVLPVFERLGDVRSRAVTMGNIADILQARGQLDEALRILRDEVLPVFERLGDLRFRAVTMGKIADILQSRGQLDEALRIRQDEQLPVYERLGDVRERAVTMGKIADILHARGQLDEARSLRNEVLEALRKLGDVDGIAATLWSLAVLDLAEEKVDAAQPRIAEAFALLRRLGRADGLAVVGEKLAQLMAAAGERNQAAEVLRISAEAYRKLGRIADAERVERLLSDVR